MVKGRYEGNRLGRFASVRKFDLLRHCPNCKGGKADGGFAKRVKKEMEALEIERDAVISKIKPDKKEELRITEEGFDKKIKDLKDAKPRVSSTCAYCKGSTRQTKSIPKDVQAIIESPENTDFMTV